MRVYVDVRLRRRLTVQTLQRKVTSRVTLLPGAPRVTVRVTFERGSGSPPVTLACVSGCAVVVCYDLPVN